MPKIVDYYFSPISPWTYLGHPRLTAMLKKYGAQVNLKPMDLGKIFPVSGGLPLPQRAPQRQAYRLMELARWRDHLKMPLTMKPKFFPAPGDLASCCIIAAASRQKYRPLQIHLRTIFFQHRREARMAQISPWGNRRKIVVNDLGHSGLVHFL